MFSGAEVNYLDYGDTDGDGVDNLVMGTGCGGYGLRVFQDGTQLYHSIAAGPVSAAVGDVDVRVAGPPGPPPPPPSTNRKLRTNLVHQSA